MPFLLTRQNIELWEASFDLSKQFSTLYFYIPQLLKSYLSFPDQGGYAPKPETVLQLLCFFLEKKVKNLSELELVFDIVRDRLQRSSSMCQITSDRDKQSILILIRQLSTLVECATKKIFQLPANDFPKTILISQSLISTLAVYESNVSSLTMTSVDPNENMTVDQDPLLRWSSSPTIDWLIDGSLYERIGLKRCYADGQEYVNTVRKVWAMLTFYWGTAAFWPKCGCQSHGGGPGAGGVSEARACATPLLTHIGGGGSAGSFYCTKRGSSHDGRCGRPALWRCMKKDHDAICQRCLIHRQRALMGPSSLNASTDIYDATIQSIQLHGDAHLLHLKNVLSRKPPKENVNWKTSYRLQPSMLVGVIHLHGRNLDLRSSMKIHWGEIILQDKKNGPQQEYIRRKDQFLSIRLLSRSDCPDLIVSHDMKFSRDSHVAVVDMRVFVPEVMTVLSTLGQRSFLDGFTRVSFSKYLLSPEYQDTSPSLPSELSSASLYDHLRVAFQRTTIDCLSTLSEERKEIILQKICHLQVVQSLDRTQREAFVHALLRPLHCTQGPPGTGKVRLFPTPTPHPLPPSPSSLTIPQFTHPLHRVMLVCA
jgi:hypothetical protein